MINLKYRALGKTGLFVSPLSFGASSLGSVFRDIDEKEGINTVHAAVDAGVNYIDVSPYYGATKAEVVLGKALKELPRDKIILSSKAGRYGGDLFDFSYNRIIKSGQESLHRLNTDYLDLLYLHDIEFGNYAQVIEEGIPALKYLKEQGYIRFFGVSALPLPVLKKTMEETNLDVILSYCHYSLNDMSLLELIPDCINNKVGIVNASPLSMGLLHSNETPSWHPADHEVIRTCKKAADYCSTHGEDIAKLAIQFSTRNEQIPTTLVSSASVKNMQKNIEWMEETVNESLLQEVLSILAPIKNRTWPSGKPDYHQKVSRLGGEYL